MEFIYASNVAHPGHIGLLCGHHGLRVIALAMEQCEKEPLAEEKTEKNTGGGGVDGVKRRGDGDMEGRSQDAKIR